MRALRRICFISIILTPICAWADTFLLMAEEDGCYWCAAWNEEISHIYPKTQEGKLAPLWRYDINDKKPDILFERRVHFTPTFVLVRNRKEIGRIEGYPGEDHFWALLTMLFERANIAIPKGN